MEALTDVLPEDLDFNLKCFLSKWGSSNISLIRLSRSSSFSNVSANLGKPRAFRGGACSGAESGLGERC